MTRNDRLSEYHARRRGGRTPEPRGGHRRGRRQARFVVQRHDGSRSRFHFRPEIGGVLVSWSVPTGPSLDPRDKRLAVRTEDRPIEYATFEGVIPADQYAREQWLLMKIDDEDADRRRKPARTRLEPALSGRTNMDLE